jgi:hypothetical protein
MTPTVRSVIATVIPLAMKSYIPLILMLGLAVGCNAPNKDPKIQSLTSAENPESKFDSAIETIATSADMAEVHAADLVLREGGMLAITALREHLKDNRVPPSDYLTRAVSRKPSMGTHCYWLIQDVVEPPVPKRFASLYATLNAGNIEEWLDERSGKSIIDLKIDAATNSLKLAQDDFDTNTDASVNRAVEIYRERLAVLQGQ